MEKKNKIWKKKIKFWKKKIGKKKYFWEKNFLLLYLRIVTKSLWNHLTNCVNVDLEIGRFWTIENDGKN